MEKEKTISEIEIFLAASTKIGESYSSVGFFSWEKKVLGTFKLDTSIDPLKKESPKASHE